MRDLDALPGLTIKREEDEFYAYASVHVDGESLSIRIPLGDGRYLAQIVHDRIVCPAIAPRITDQPTGA